MKIFLNVTKGIFYSIILSWTTKCEISANLPAKWPLFCKFSKLWLHVTWLKVFSRMPSSGKNMLPLKEIGCIKIELTRNFHVIIREHDHFLYRTRYWKSAEFYGEYFLFNNFFCKSGSFRVIGLNVKFSLIGLIEMSAILKVRLTSTFSNGHKMLLRMYPFIWTILHLVDRRRDVCFFILRLN